MASSKRLYLPRNFLSRLFGGGLFRGVGAEEKPGCATVTQTLSTPNLVTHTLTTPNTATVTLTGCT